MEIFVFGQLTDMVGKVKLEIGEITDTAQLRDRLVELFPAMKGIKFMIAVDKKMVNQNIALRGSEHVALMPPFSGG